MTFGQPWSLQALCYTYAEDRAGFNATVCGEGVRDVSGGDLAVTTGGAGLDLTIAAGRAFIQGDQDPDQGMYQVANDADDTVTADPADPTDPRIDQVIVTIRDSQYGGLDNDGLPSVLAGTPTTGADLTNLDGAEPLPDNAIRLAYVLVPATFTGPFVDATHILDARESYSLCGGSQWQDWTPTVTFSGTETVDVARYIENGNLVTCYVRISVLTNPGLAQSLAITPPVPGSSLVFFNGNMVIGVTNRSADQFDIHGAIAQDDGVNGQLVYLITNGVNTSDGLTATFCYEKA